VVKVLKKKPAFPAQKEEGIMPSISFPYLKRAKQKALAFLKLKR
jgi:hypothetical protein